MTWFAGLPASNGAIVFVSVLLTGCVQTIDRPPVRLPQYATPYVVPAPVSQVRSGDAIDSSVRSLAKRLMASTSSRIGERRIAVLPMRDLSGQAATLATTANDAFRVELFRSGSYYFVADNDMKRALREVWLVDKLRTADKTLDPSVLSGLKRMLSADLVIDTQITDSITDFRLTSEMIDIATGRLVGVENVLLPKTVITGAAGESKRAGEIGEVLDYGDRWLHTQFVSIGRDANRGVKAVFAFTNKQSGQVRLAAFDPERRAYLVDEAGTPIKYVGSDGLDAQGATIVQPDTRHEVNLYFAPVKNVKGLLTLRTSWQARGAASGSKDFVVRDLVVSR